MILFLPSPLSPFLRFYGIFVVELIVDPKDLEFLLAPENAHTDNLTKATMRFYNGYIDQTLKVPPTFYHHHPPSSSFHLVILSCILSRAWE